MNAIVKFEQSLPAILDADLAEAVKSQTAFTLGGNIAVPGMDDHDPEGVIYTESEAVETWRLPALIDGDLKERAAEAYTRLRDEWSPPSLPELGEWIAELGTVCAKRKEVDRNVKEIVTAYAKHLLAKNYPAECFTDQTIVEAAQQFKWFPDISELHEFLQTKAGPMRRTLERLRDIAKADPRDLRGTWDYMDAEQRKAYWDKMRKERAQAVNDRFGVDAEKLNAMSREEAAEYAKQLVKGGET